MAKTDDSAAGMKNVHFKLPLIFPLRYRGGAKDQSRAHQSAIIFRLITLLNTFRGTRAVIYLRDCGAFILKMLNVDGDASLSSRGRTASAG